MPPKFNDFNTVVAITDIHGNTWQEETEEVAGFVFENNGPERKPEYDDQVSTYWELTELQQVLMDTLIYKWRDIHFNQILKNLEVETNCNDCPSVSLELVVAVDHEGNIIDVLVERDMVRCRTEELNRKLGRRIISSVKLLEIPEGLWDKILQIRIGRTLKC